MSNVKVTEVSTYATCIAKPAGPIPFIVGLVTGLNLRMGTWRLVKIKYLKVRVTGMFGISLCTTCIAKDTGQLRNIVTQLEIWARGGTTGYSQGERAKPHTRLNCRLYCKNDWSDPHIWTLYRSEFEEVHLAMT